MGRHTRARIDLAALRSNYWLAARQAQPARAMAVIKADGYGHGLERVAHALAGETKRFAVATLEEAERLRAAGITQPVVLLEGVHECGDLSRCARAEFEPVIHEHWQLDGLETTGSCRLWVKVNTGMNRLGFRVEEVAGVLERLAAHGSHTVLGLMTHYACADDPADRMTVRQQRALAELLNRGGLWGSAANSAAHFHSDLPPFDWTRPGIMLYGATPMVAGSAADLGLTPVMTLESRLIAVRTLQPGETVGYGGTWTAERPTRMGVVSIGYGDGYPRHAPNGTPAAVNGVRVPTIGRVSMDMMALDLSAVPDAEAGDPVELWGAHVPVDEVADWAGTIGYELLTGVTARVPRYYVDE
ncbi:alanine racemase [Tamilnaduibacter salinus]|uniref:Alanine racemase n=1 Tax=Tamilnaduibacter salinus TaxID=1484056 RepID=A0A2A2I7H8_9GAMM|nr:alanine racemase [Tamilnaduibacter salinus]PAV27276.1 alanine racemase [Tamilnaduibacter salinus]